MDLKFKDNSKLRIAPFTQLEYIDANGSCRIDTDIVVNYNTSVMQSIMQIDAFPSDQWLYSWIVGSSTSAFGLGWDLNSNADRPIKLYPGSSATSFNFPRNERHDIEVYIDNGGKLKYDGELILSNSAGAIIPNNSKFKFSFGGRLPFRYYRVCVKQSGVTVLDLYPVLDTRNVVCFYDVISETLFYNKGTGNFIASPAVKQVLPETILLKTTTLYHENTPNIGGLQLLNSIINYQKTHQDEVKEYYYPTTQLWQDIITEYPDIVQYYNMNHKLCIPICEADDPEQCAEDLLQTIEDYPDIIDVIVDYPSLTPIIIEWHPIIHSLIDTGYENVLQSDRNSYIATNITPKDGLEIDSIIYGNSGCFYGVVHQGNGGGMWFVLYANTAYMVTYNAGTISFTLNSGRNEIKQTYNGSLIVNGDNCGSKTGTPSSSHAMIIFGDFDIKASIPELSAAKLSMLSAKLNSTTIATFVPFYRNGHYGMLDIHDLSNPTFYPNAGSGEFTYSLEPKNA